MTPTPGDGQQLPLTLGEFGAAGHARPRVRMRDEPSHMGGAAGAPGGDSVTKPVEAVLIRPQEGKLTLLKRRFFNILLYHAQRQPAVDGAYFELSLARLTQDAQFESRNMAHLVDVLNQLLSTVVNWGDSPKNLKGPKYRWEGAALLAYARLEKTNERSTKLVYDFHREMRAQLLNPSVYVRVSLMMNATLRSHAALALYELACRYRTNRDGLSKRLPWREWVPILTGNPDIDPKHAQYKYFARDVLRPAIAEVNMTQQDFVVDVLEEKTGRRVESLQFVVKPRVPSQDLEARETSLASEASVEALALVGRLINLKVPQEAAERACTQYGSAKVSAAAAVLESRAGASNLDPISNPTAYLRKLLTDPTLVPAPPGPQESARAEREGPSSKEPVLVRIRREYLAQRQRELYELYLESSSSEQEEQLRDFEDEYVAKAPSVIQREWRQFRTSKSGRLGAFLQAPFRVWLAAKEAILPDEELLAWAAQSNIIRI